MSHRIHTGDGLTGGGRRDVNEGRKQRLGNRRREREALLMRNDVEVTLARADEARIVTEAVEGDFWKKVIRPLLVTQVEAFSEIVLSEGLTGVEFEKQQYNALRFKAMVDHIESLVGQEKELLKAAEETHRAVEDAEEEGLIVKQPPSEGVPADAR